VSVLQQSATRRVIVVTDGDSIARRALTIAARRTHCRIISRSAGNPTPLSGVEMVRLIKQTPYDPVIVMLDDNGDGNEAKGEEALQVLLAHPDVVIIGALVVASNTHHVTGVPVDFSIDRQGHRVETAVDKDGIATDSFLVFGDTVDALRDVGTPIIIGIGDIGKMGGRDAPERGAPVTTKALRTLIQQGGHRTQKKVHVVQRAHSIPRARA